MPLRSFKNPKIQVAVFREATWRFRARFKLSASIYALRFRIASGMFGGEIPYLLAATVPTHRTATAVKVTIGMDYKNPRIEKEPSGGPYHKDHRRSCMATTTPAGGY